MNATKVVDNPDHIPEETHDTMLFCSSTQPAPVLFTIDNLGSEPSTQATNGTKRTDVLMSNIKNDTHNKTRHQLLLALI